MFSTPGIVLDHVNYSETSIVVHIYTSLFGPQSYMVNGVRRSKNKGKAVFLQPLTLMQLEVTRHEKKEIHRIVDFKVIHPFKTIPFDQTKRAITFFITEVLSKALREEHPNEELFRFVFHSVRVLDEDVAGVTNFHLFFMFKLSRFLGFGASDQADGAYAVFDLKNSEFRETKPDHPYFIEGDTLKNWRKLSELEAGYLDRLKLSSLQRRELLNALVLYYELHILNFKTLKSIKVLHALFEV